MFFFFPDFKGTSFEIHYWFNDYTHQMDAVVQHRCEAEVMALIKAIAADFGEEITIETAPFGEGGLRRWFKIVTKTEDSNATLTATIIVAFATSVLITPLGTALTKLTETLIEKVFKDEEDQALDKEKKKAEIESIKADTKLKEQQLEKNTSVIKRRSNFYGALERYPKVDKVSVVIQDDLKRPQSDEQFVERKAFKEFILATDELEPKEIDNAVIEIISPVLKKGTYHWRGFYNGAPISFSMKSNEFKTLVQTGQVEFKNGTSIDCLLEVKGRWNNEGEEEVTEYNVLRVNKYFDNDHPIETPEGKSHRKKIEADEQQLKLFPKPKDNQ